MTEKKIGTPTDTHTHSHTLTCCLTFSCVLLMEDFSDHTVFYFDHDQERLPSEYFMAAVEGMAEFHAEWMNHPLFKDKALAWLNNTTVCDWTSQRSSLLPSPPPKRKPSNHLLKLSNRIALLMKRFAGMRIKEEFSPEAAELFIEWAKEMPELWKKLSKRVTTLIHGDLWVNNISFAQPQPPGLLPCFGENSFAAVDWQTCCKVY